LSAPPASISSTLWRPSALSRFANTQPALPAPTTMKSASLTPLGFHSVYGLGLAEAVEALRPHFAAQTRRLEAAERRAEVEGEVVQAEGAGAHRAGGLERPLPIFGEHRPAQAVGRIVGDPDG